MPVQSYEVRPSLEIPEKKKGFNILQLGGVIHGHLGLGQACMYMLGKAIVIFMTF